MAKNKNKNKTGAATKSTKPQGANEDRQLIHRVIKKQESITRKDIADWKRARQQASNVNEPKQVLLQNLYEETMLDALMTSQVSVLRIGRSQGVDFTLKLNGEADEEQTQLLKDSGLYEDTVEFIIESLFFGHSVVEFEYDIAGVPTVDLIPRAHVSPEMGRFYPDVTGSEFVEYRDLAEFGKWLVEFYPRKRDLGLLNKAVPYVLMKKFAISCWSELCEIFGIPPRVMKTNTTDDAMLQRAESMMKEIGSAAYFIIDTTENFEFAQGSSTNGDVYKNLISTCDQQLSLLNLAAVLGQDTENGNRSKEESSSKLLDAVIKADNRLIQSTWNKILLPALAAIGFLKPGLRLEIAKEMDTEKMWKMVYEASQYYEIDPEWIKTTFGIEVIGKKATPAMPLPPAGGDPGEEEKEGPQGFFAEAPQGGALAGNDPTAFNEGLIERVADRKSTYWDAELFWRLSSEFLNAIKTPAEGGLKAAEKSVEYGVADDAYRAAQEMNLFHFSAAKTLAEIQELNQAFKEAKNYNDFRNKAASITNTFNDKWQRTEYRTALQVAESSSAYRQLRAQESIFPYWVYRTVGDGQVRPEHAALDGLTLPSNDPMWSRIYPPNDWGCRCWVDALMADEFEGDFELEREKVSEFMETAEWKRSAAQGWGVNRADTAEVFTANQMYIRKFPDQAASLVGKLHANHYGLPSFGKRLAAATDSLPGFKESPSGWFAKNSHFKDFSGKTVALSSKVFKIHTSGSYEATRVPLLGSISDVLAHPDEVWINDYKGEFKNLNYIKFYQGKAINVVCNIDKGRAVEVATWFEIEKNPNIKEGGKQSRQIDPRWRYRRGLLIKK